jgi:hypothetical protein
VAQALALDDMSHEKMAECDRQAAAQLETFAECEDREALPPVARPTCASVWWTMNNTTATGWSRI